MGAKQAQPDGGDRQLAGRAYMFDNVLRLEEASKVQAGAEVD